MAHVFLLGGADGAVHLFDATTGAEIGRLESEYRDTPKSLISAAWSPDERQVAAGDVDGTIHLWNVATGTELQAFSGHDGYAGSVMFSPDGSTLLTSGNDRIVRTWTLVPPLDPRDLKGNLAEIYTLATSPDGRYLVSGGNDRSVRLYDLTSGQQLRYFVAESPEISSAIAHENSVNSVQISPDGRYVLSGGSDGFLRLWSIADGTQVRELEYPDRQPVYAGVFAPDGKSFVTTSEDGTLRRWDTETFAELKVLQRA
ncbi:MAG: WD40 repeat domain-containing protein [Anaerolineae bacterium]